jgi:hypothetical protein
MAHVHAVGRGIETHINSARLLLQKPLHIYIVGGLIDQLAPGKLLENVGHE